MLSSIAEGQGSACYPIAKGQGSACSPIAKGQDSVPCFSGCLQLAEVVT